MVGSADLLKNVKNAVRKTIIAVQTHRPHEILAGYALLTDDGLTNLAYTAITQEALASGQADDLLFSPTDWPYDYEVSSFSAASEFLRAAADDDDSRERVQTAFTTLEQAIAESQAEGLFRPDVFLSVLSTDPSPYLEALEKGSVERLNSPKIVAARERFLQRWMR